MRLKPAATNASSSLNEVGSSAVQPKTLPPKANGATSSPDLPSPRFIISTLTRACGKPLRVSLHEELAPRLDGLPGPVSEIDRRRHGHAALDRGSLCDHRSEEHTSELQS